MDKQYIIVAGDNELRFRFTGPFTTFKAAQFYLEANWCILKSGIITTLSSPLQSLPTDQQRAAQYTQDTRDMLQLKRDLPELERRDLELQKANQPELKPMPSGGLAYINDPNATKALANDIIERHMVRRLSEVEEEVREAAKIIREQIGRAHYSRWQDKLRVALSWWRAEKKWRAGIKP